MLAVCVVVVLLSDVCAVCGSFVHCCQRLLLAVVVLLCIAVRDFCFPSLFCSVLLSEISFGCRFVVVYCCLLLYIAFPSVLVCCSVQSRR